MVIIMRKKVVLFTAVVAIVMVLTGCGQAGGITEPDGGIGSAAGELGAGGAKSVAGKLSVGDAADAGGAFGTSKETGGDTQNPADSRQGNVSQPTWNEAPQTVREVMRIVDGAEKGCLVLAGEEAGELYTLYVSDIAVYLDGEPADASVLEDGMMAEVVYSELLETYPAQLGGAESVSVYSRGTKYDPLGTYYDLCGLYLQVLDDLWDRDSGLNDGAAYVSIDLSDAPGGLTEGEKSAIAYVFGCMHQVEALTYSYEELAEKGYLAEVEWASHPQGIPAVYQWEDGVLFSITAHDWAEGEAYSLPVLKFDAKKWRSPLGAYYFHDCSAMWAEGGSWGGYSIGGEMIS
ncbi:MAG: hypothetical protein NC413_03435 [Muribaculum sp.]|nr:hypothetical protein [Muribaculum sp.]